MAKGAGPLKRPWLLRAPFDRSEIDALAKASNISQLAARICWLRGYRTVDAVEKYLRPSLAHLSSPWVLDDMHKAVERILRAHSEATRILIFGDYDVDGTAGAALLGRFFKILGFEPLVWQPDRFLDGYGLGPQFIDRAQDAGIGLIVAVDCGSSSFEAATRARELGMDVIVLDHHALDKGVPDFYACVNPQRGDFLRELCGCGVAFYLAIALRQRWREKGLFHNGEPNLRSFLDLVTIATACDMVPLQGDNHILVRTGMEVLRQTDKVGLRALLDQAGVFAGQKQLTPSLLGFVLGPRINASGRMASASTALELLMTDDEVRAKELAQVLESLNTDRMVLQDEIWKGVQLKLEQGVPEFGIVLWDDAWHEGVVGIVASRIVDVYRRPAIVISAQSGKGSVRSAIGIDVLAVLAQLEDYLVQYGGHRFAAGVRVKDGQLKAFAQAFNAACQSAERHAHDALLVDGKCSYEELSLEVLYELERMGPFGPGNPEPLVCIEARAESVKLVKERHIRMQLFQGTQSLSAIWFHGKDYVEGADVFDGSWAGVPEVNRFRGRETLSFRIRDYSKELWV